MLETSNTASEWMNVGALFLIESETPEGFYVYRNGWRLNEFDPSWGRIASFEIVFYKHVMPPASELFLLMRLYFFMVFLF